MWHLSKKKNIQYITTFTVKFQTFKSIYQREENKSWSSLVPCIPHELKAGASSRRDHFSYVQYCVYTMWCDYKHKIHFLWLNFKKFTMILGDFGWISTRRGKPPSRRFIRMLSKPSATHASSISFSMFPHLFCKTFIFYKKAAWRQSEERPPHACTVTIMNGGQKQLKHTTWKYIWSSSIPKYLSNS